ncbi:hypothetical protein ACIGBH_32775 [Streptomyces sp. NPDC085929]|uniref:nSTAND1 domain-containing NTPase n=1 Tax=Streptomyces sp. NPDC085929 TaxID=3365739 RepID=UPI0037D207A4
MRRDGRPYPCRHQQRAGCPGAPRIHLDLLWQRQGGGALTHQAYEQLGGVPGALGAYADRVWAEQVATS